MAGSEVQDKAKSVRTSYINAVSASAVERSAPSNTSSEVRCRARPAAWCSSKGLPAARYCFPRSARLHMIYRVRDRVRKGSPGRVPISSRGRGTWRG
jgi:hypothetical protein